MSYFVSLYTYGYTYKHFYLAYIASTKPSPLKTETYNRDLLLLIFFS